MTQLEILIKFRGVCCQQIRLIAEHTYKTYIGCKEMKNRNQISKSQEEA